MLRLYIDEDAMDKDLARALRARRVDVLTARDAGLIERDDGTSKTRCSASNYGRAIM
jgi:hypothetical protein